MLVSVIIATYNRSAELKRAIESVLAQTYSDYELIVIDDCSTDDTEDIVGKFEDKRIKYKKLSKNSGGSFVPRCIGLKVATGEYIAILDDDDYWVDRYKLILQTLYLWGHPESVMVGTDAITCNGGNSMVIHHHYPRTHIEIKNKILMHNCFYHSSVMYRKETCLAIGGYHVIKSGYYKNFIDEYELWLRMGLKGELINLPIYGVGHSCPCGNLRLKDRICLMISHVILINKYKEYYPHYLKANIFRLVIIILELPLLIKIKNIARK